MLRSLVRWKFVDRNWGAEDLELIANFWMDHYDEAEHPPHKSWESDQTLELRLTGFPRSATAAVSNELARRLGETGVAVDVLTADKDTLVAKTKPREGNCPPFPGFGVHALAGAPFDGMLIELRYTVADAGAGRSAPELVGATLVIVGELRGGSVAVKSVWADPAFDPVEAWWQWFPPAEVRILKRLDRYRKRGKVSRTFAHDVFNDRLEQQRNLNGTFRRFWLWLTEVPFGRSRVRGLLGRYCACFTGMLVLTLALLLDSHGVVARPGTLFLPTVLLALPWIVFALGLVRVEFPLLTTFHTQRWEWYRALYYEPDRYAALTPSDPRPWRDDPVVRKLTAEVLEAGFVHAGDASSLPIANAGVVHRIFLAPDGITYLALAFHYASGTDEARSHTWPANLYAVLCQTFDSDGCRFETTTYEPSLWILKRRVPETEWLVLAPTTHPIDLYRAHVDAVHEWANESDAAALPHEPFDHYLERQEKISQQECKVYWAKPYTQMDHFRWYLQLDVQPSANPE